MRLKDLLEELEYECVGGEPDREVGRLVYDSRKLEKDCVFVCISGANFDGHSKAYEACKKGAAAIITEKETEVCPGCDTAIIRTPDTRRALALLSAAYFGHPSRSLRVIGITGTKGKTTTTYLIKSMLEQTGLKVGLIGTIEAIIGDEHIPALNTTPESFVIQEYFKRMVDAGIQAVVMEVSSQGLMMKRTDGIEFELGIFTNIEPDHIGPNEHRDFDDYLRCKSLLFRQCRTGILNADSEHVKDILKGHTCKVETYGIEGEADIKAVNINYVNQPGVLGVEFDTKGLTELHAFVPTPGLFSVYNALCAIAVCRHFNITGSEVEKALSTVHVRGRIEPVRISDSFTLIIDYAHNAMALKSLLSTLKAYSPRRLVCLFGCGGNRARSRRFEMGEVSGRLADLTVITSDNPRFEEPLDIIADIRTGIDRTGGRYVEIPDRGEAVKYVIENAESGDVIVLAGKGHEDYQEIKGVKYHMDERELIMNAVKELNLEKGCAL
ncbi:MAG TPA: UDP-N-acetylmuramoyl-L-alanyl-D-glutamate--2,6-diaminopimelate ligase [Lachnospiraceae bacterium]|nr:UDP-N-acetylmuramoyl-L-alanyl-D-glutamate--2,6-diaminopimelate ligase [Lachnospiraceae bacterium]